MIPELHDKTLSRMAAVIARCMNFKSGESALITGGLHSWKLIEMLRLECARKYVSSVIDLSTDDFNRSYLNETSITFLRTLPRGLAAVANTIDAYVNISKFWDPSSIAGLPLEKLVAQSEMQKEFENIIQKRGVRRLIVGYPTKPMARCLGVSFEELKELIVGGMLCSQELLLSRCRVLAKYLKGADRVHLKDSDGTDLLVSVRDRRINMSDGLISEEDQKIGYKTANLPTGEVFIAVHEDFGDGTLFCPLTRDRLTNVMIRNALLVFEHGKLLLDKSSCEEGEEELRSSLVAALRSDRRKFTTARTLNVAELGLGLNEKIRKPIGYVLTDEKIGGSAHVAIGDNQSYGGTSQSSLHWDFVTGTREDVTVIYPDRSDKKIIDEGRIIVA